MVDVFRPKEELYGIAEQAIAIGAKVLWGQIGIYDDEAAALAEDAGLKVVMDRCPKIELFRPFWKPPARSPDLSCRRWHRCGHRSPAAVHQEPHGAATGPTCRSTLSEPRTASSTRLTLRSLEPVRSMTDHRPSS